MSKTLAFLFQLLPLHWLLLSAIKIMTTGVKFTTVELQAAQHSSDLDIRPGFGLVSGLSRYRYVSFLSWLLPVG